jgi:hypothetical protein
MMTSIGSTVVSMSVMLPIWGQMGGVGGMGGMGGMGGGLGRGGDRAGHRGGRAVDFTFYGALLGNYATGIAPTSSGSDGSFRNSDLYGGAVEGGLSGAKSWGRSTFGVDWRGDYRRTSSNTGIFGNINGSDQAVALYYGAQPSRRLLYQVSVTGVTTNRAVGGFVAPSFDRPELTGLPLNDIVNNRVYAATGTAGVGYMLSRRDQIAFWGGGYLARRASRSLVGTNGTMAGATYTHMVDRSTSIGGGYFYMKYRFPSVFGGTDLHGATLNLERRINRDWQATLQLGAVRQETLSSQRVALDPIIAEILGTSEGVRAGFSRTISPNINASINYRVSRRSSCNLSVFTGVTPGNGLFLTSRNNTQNLGCSTAYRKFSLSFSGGRSSYSALAQDIGRFNSWQGGGGFNYLIRPNLNFTTQLDARTFSITTGSSRVAYAATVGLALSPSELPLPRW